MRLAKHFCIHPGPTRGGHGHFVTAYRLVKLYGLKPGEYSVAPHRWTFADERWQRIDSYMQCEGSRTKGMRCLYPQDDQSQYKAEQRKIERMREERYARIQ